MNAMDVIRESGVVAVIRGVEPDKVSPLAEALARGGVRALEVTVESPRAFQMIERLVEDLGGRALVGAGTVLDPESARTAILAGAEFILSPTVREETIRMTKRYGKVSVPGAMTPTEILTAYESGADLVKVFPASTLGVRYIQEVRGPLGHIPLLPTGGVNLDNVRDFIRAGVVAVGIGGALVDRRALADGDFDQIEKKATAFVEAVRAAR